MMGSGYVRFVTGTSVGLISKFGQRLWLTKKETGTSRLSCCSKRCS